VHLQILETWGVSGTAGFRESPHGAFLRTEDDTPVSSRGPIIEMAEALKTVVRRHLDGDCPWRRRRSGWMVPDDPEPLVFFLLQNMKKEDSHGVS